MASSRLSNIQLQLVGTCATQEDSCSPADLPTHLMYSEGAVDACTIDRLALLIEPPDRWAHALQNSSRVSSWGQGLNRWASAALPLGCKHLLQQKPLHVA